MTTYPLDRYILMIEASVCKLMSAKCIVDDSLSWICFDHANKMLSNNEAINKEKCNKLVLSCFRVVLACEIKRRCLETNRFQVNDMVTWSIGKAMYCKSLKQQGYSLRFIDESLELEMSDEESKKYTDVMREICITSFRFLLKAIDEKKLISPQIVSCALIQLSASMN